MKRRQLSTHYIQSIFRLFAIPPLIVILLASCSSAPEIELPEGVASLENLQVVNTTIDQIPELNLERVTRYGDTDDIIIGRIGSLAVDSAGRVYISDNSRLVIHIYDPNGSYLTQIGGEGDGPGEFRRITSIVPLGDFIHVLDRNSLRITRFHMEDYSFAENKEIPIGDNINEKYLPYPTKLSVIDSDHYMIHFGVGMVVNSASEPMIAGRIMNWTDATLEENVIYTFPANDVIIDREGGSQRMMPMDYKRSSHLVMDNDSQIIYSWSDDLLFKFYDTKGDYQKAVYLPYEKVPLNRNEVLAEYSDVSEPWISMIRNDNMPDTWPAFSKMMLDDKGRIWISLITSDSETYTWLLINPSTGEASGRINRDSGKWSAIDVKDGHLFALEVNAESGLVEVVKYKIND
jgi:hypothetical protein